MLVDKGLEGRRQLITGKIDGVNDLARNVLLPTYRVVNPLYTFSW